MSQSVLETVKEAVIQTGTSSALGADTPVEVSMPGAGRVLGGWSAGAHRSSCLQGWRRHAVPVDGCDLDLLSAR